MWRKWAVLFLLASCLLSPPLSAEPSPWSHIQTDIPGVVGDLTSELLLSTWISRVEPIRFCLFVASDDTDAQESARIEVRAGLDAWLSAPGRYDPDLTVTDARGELIDLPSTPVEELECELVPDGYGAWAPRGRDAVGQEIQKESFLSVFYLSMGHQYGYNQSLSFVFSHDTAGDRPKLRTIRCLGHPTILIPIPFVSLSQMTKPEHRDQMEALLTEWIPERISRRDELDVETPYSMREFCPEFGGPGCTPFLTESFTGLLHELGHAFGLGDEYYGGDQPSNDPLFMSAFPQEGVMNNDDLLYPWKDDVVGLVYRFDRLAGRSLDERTFRFRNHPEERYAQSEESRARQQKEFSFPPGTRHLSLRKVTKELFVQKALPKLRAHDTPVQQLVLYSSSIETPTGISSLTSLKRLYFLLSGLKGFPAEVLRLPQLEDLMFNNEAEVTSIPAEIARLVSLRSLILNGAGVEVIPAEIAKLPKLDTLLLFNSPVRTLPPELTTTKSLRILGLNPDRLDLAGQKVLQSLRGKPGLTIYERPSWQN